MEIAFTQDIHYTNKGHLPLSDVANALLALERTSTPIAKILESLFEDVVVEGIRLEIDELHSGSLTERIRYYLSIAFQKHIEKESGLELKRLEEADNEKRSNIAAWVVAATILIALKAAGDKVWPSKPKEHIEQQVNITLEAGRDIMGIDTEILRNRVEAAVMEQPESVRGAVVFAKPAKRDPEAEIMLNEKPFLTKKSLQDVPGALNQDEEQEKVIELEGVEVHIRATDRDSGKRGWGAAIPEFTDKRIRIHVAPGIDLDYLAHCDVVIGDVAIFYTVDEKGNISKPHAHLFSIDQSRTEALRQ